MFDDSRVRIKTVSASLTITQPPPYRALRRVFELLEQSAVFGREARRLIGRALRDLTRPVRLILPSTFVNPFTRLFAARHSAGNHVGARR